MNHSLFIFFIHMTFGSVVARVVDCSECLARGKAESIFPLPLGSLAATIGILSLEAGDHTVE